jgi:hypothetical protein
MLLRESQGQQWLWTSIENGVAVRAKCREGQLSHAGIHNR